MQNKNIVISVIVCVVIAGISFWGGMKYDASKAATNQISNRGGQQGQFNQNGGGKGIRGGINGGGTVSGQILSNDGKTMTVSLRSGGSTVVLFSPSTKIEKTVDGITSDVAVGKSVMIMGTPNTDGSFNATSIQIRPAFPVGPTQTKTN